MTVSQMTMPPIGGLIAAGARVRVVANDDETPLHLAVKSGNFDGG